MNNALFDRSFTDHLPRLQNLWHGLRKHEQRVGHDESAKFAALRQLLSAPPIEAARAEDIGLQTLFSKRSYDNQADTEAKALEQDWRKAIEQRYADAEKLLRELES